MNFKNKSKLLMRLGYFASGGAMVIGGSLGISGFAGVFANSAYSSFESSLNYSYVQEHPDYISNKTKNYDKQSNSLDNAITGLSFFCAGAGLGFLVYRTSKEE